MADRVGKSASKSVAQRRNLSRVLTEALEQRRMLAADLVVSEFLASNGAGLTDSFGDKSDWIEIHNRGDAAATLGDYFLTDDATVPSKWRFPVQNLAAGAYLVVFASDRNLAVAGQQLHTNFKLGGGGEYLGLMRSDGTPQSDYAPTYPAQTTDVSYGLTNENSPTSGKQFFATPTPGAINVPSASAPVFSVPGKVFTDTLSVAITSTTPGATIRYTVDRSEPTASSPVYTAPISVTSTRMIRAKVFAAGFNPSPTQSQTYVLAGASVTPINTNLGTIVIDTFGVGLNDSTYVLGSGTFIDNRGDGRSSVTDTVDYHGRIGVRTRGSSTQGLPKKSLAVELWDEANDDRKVSLLGMPADSDWILYAPYMEKSLMQNSLAFDWAKDMGLLAPRLRYVEVYLNTDGGASINYASDYVGIYLLMEKIKISEERLDIAELGPTDNAEPAVTGGYLWKRDRIDPDEQVITTASGQQFPMVDPERLTTQQTSWLTNHLNEFESVLNGPNYKDPVNGYAKYVDVDSFVNFWLLTEMTRQIDAYALSTFYYKDRGGKITMGPVWDWNLSLGNAYYAEGSYAAGTSADFINSFSSAYFRRMMTDPAFKKKVVDRWGELRQTSLSNTRLLADVDARVSELSDGNGNYPVGSFPTQTSNNALVRNFKKWDTQGRYIWPNGFFDQSGRWIEDVKMMKDFMIGRVNWLDSQYLPAPAYSQPGGYRTSPTSVSLTPARASNTDVTLLGPGAPVKAIIPSSDINGWRDINYNTAGWLSGTGGVGFDTTPTPFDFNSMVGLNVGAMQNVRASVFIRYEFNIADPNAINSLILKLKYEDGFVAFLNNHRIASSNDPGTGPSGESPFSSSYTATALSARSESAAFSFQEFDVTALKSVLVAGKNVLAIQGLNASIDSSDLIILPELVSRTRLANTANADTQVWYTLDGSDPLLSDGITRNPAALLYTGAISVAATSHVKSRSLRSGVWSALGDQYYNFDADALRVNEIMYNPAAPPAGSPFGAQDFEFVELRNGSDQPLHLEGYEFSEGIEFTFPAMTLPAGGVVAIVKNLAAFQSRYGTSVVPIGVFGGALDNGGETLTLDNPFSDVSQSFLYDDAWYPSTDGAGPSMEVNGPATLDLNFKPSWRASEVTGGTPGTATVLDTTPPAVASSQFWFETSPNSVKIAFSEDVGPTLTLADIVVTNLTTGLAIVPASLAFDATTKTATLTFAAGPMTDGTYSVVLVADGITDAAGNKLDGDANSSAGGDFTFSFSVRAGDANRDGMVGFDDLVTLAQNYGFTGQTWSNADFNYDGTVNFDDLVILAQKYNGAQSMLKSLAPPAIKPVTKPRRPADGVIA